jgi:1-deoxy-D-xylulose-5-phosphate synthase
VKEGKSKTSNTIKSLNLIILDQLMAMILKKKKAYRNSNRLKKKNKRSKIFTHVITTKGKGLLQAEQNQVQLSRNRKFDKNCRGEINVLHQPKFTQKFQDVFD